jgi:hypothetical protein
MFGHRNWNELLADVGPDGCAPPDIYAPPDEQVRRVAQYLEVLQRFGFDSGKAWDLLEGAQARGWLGTGKFIDRTRFESPVDALLTTAAA